MIRINLLPEYRRKSEFPTWKLYRIIAYVFFRTEHFTVGLPFGNVQVY